MLDLNLGRASLPPTLGLCRGAGRSAWDGGEAHGVTVTWQLGAGPGTWSRCVLYPQQCFKSSISRQMLGVALAQAVHLLA